MSCNELIKTDVMSALDEHDMELQTGRFSQVAANSWKRCLKLKVNPSRHVRADISARELEKRIAAHDDLVKVATPTMENIYNFVNDADLQVVLSDNHGYLLKVLGGKKTSQCSPHAQLYPGGNWTESLRGTNAIGTCLVEKKPLKIHAAEHFFEDNRSLNCSAAPIFSADGELLAVLNLTGDQQYANDLTLGMVVAGANAIENQLQLHRANTKLFASYKYSDTIIRTMSEGLISVDPKGLITQLNTVGARIIGINARDAVGQHISELLGENAPLLDLLRTGVGYENKEVVTDGGKRTFYSSATLLHDDYGNMIGAVSVLRNSKVSKRNVRQGTTVQQARYSFDEIIGNSEAMLKTKTMAEIAAKSMSTVLIHGESGTGKELIAQGIHNASPRHAQPFVAVNCAAITETLLESELFGYEEGSFTGAKKGGHPGKVEIANGGTLFLDEIGDMPLQMQVKLLRMLQERRICRVGSTEEVSLDIRIIAATHKDIKKGVQDGTFRKDLYYRLNVLPITIPALRERLDDLPDLAEYMVKKLSERFGKGSVSISSMFLRACRSYDWPGNIRELENVIERALNMVDEGGKLTAELLDLDPVELAPVGEADGSVRPLKEMELEMVTRALDISRGNIVHASTLLGISRNTIYRKIKEYDIVI
ncbi:MAG: sigma 54-interacting transcriptional regulator [Desulfuromonas sp.]|nr:sigma 54-interacting transcriptional regulator [Desulfuromonas sp.]